MELLIEGLKEALRLLWAADPLVIDAATRSVFISVTAVVIAAALGVPTGLALADLRFPGRAFTLFLFRISMGLPTVLIGLLGFALFSRRGPLGPMELLYTTQGVMLCEVALALPIIVSWTHSALSRLDRRFAETSRTLGAGLIFRWRTLIREARAGIVLALLTAFARCFSELGIAMMVGGNIKHRTRTLATATALETSKGELARGIAMSLILLAIGVAVMMIAGLLARSHDRSSIDA